MLPSSPARLRFGVARRLRLLASAAGSVGADRLNFLVVPALNQQGGDDPFDLRGGQDAFEGGREALFI